LVFYSSVMTSAVGIHLVCVLRVVPFLITFLITFVGFYAMQGHS